MLASLPAPVRIVERKNSKSSMEVSGKLTLVKFVTASATGNL